MLGKILEVVHKKTNIEGGLPKKGAWTVCRFKGEDSARKRVVFFRGG